MDGTGGEFKITLAQQLLIAQHLLNQGQFQRVVQGSAATADGDQPQITTGNALVGSVQCYIYRKISGTIVCKIFGLPVCNLINSRIEHSVLSVKQGIAH